AARARLSPRAAQRSRRRPEAASPLAPPQTHQFCASKDTFFRNCLGSEALPREMPTKLETPAPLGKNPVNKLFLQEAVRHLAAPSDSMIGNSVCPKASNASWESQTSNT